MKRAGRMKMRAATDFKRKLQKFFKVLEHFRSCVPYTPMHELLWKIYEETGYFDYVCAMPAGSQRKANLEMLAEKAALMRVPATAACLILCDISKICRNMKWISVRQVQSEKKRIRCGS